MSLIKSRMIILRKPLLRIVKLVSFAIWLISPVLFPQGLSVIESGLPVLYSPDQKYRLERFQPGLYTPWSIWQSLGNDCVMFMRLYDNKTGQLLGQSNWFAYTNCHDLLGMLIWPGELPDEPNLFSIGDPSDAAFRGAQILIKP